VVVTGTKSGQKHARKENDIRRPQIRNAHYLSVPVNIRKSPYTDDQEWQVRCYIPEVVDGEKRAGIRELMIRRVLGKRRRQNKAENYYRK
jgi:hypothetical protein